MPFQRTSKFMGVKRVVSEPQWPGATRIVPNIILPMIGVAVFFLWIAEVIALTVYDQATWDRMEQGWGAGAQIMLSLWVLILETIHLPVVLALYLGAFPKYRLNPHIITCTSVLLLGAWSFMIWWYVVCAINTLTWVVFGVTCCMPVAYIACFGLSIRAGAVVRSRLAIQPSAIESGDRRSKGNSLSSDDTYAPSKTTANSSG